MTLPTISIVVKFAEKTEDASRTHKTRCTNINSKIYLSRLYFAGCTLWRPGPAPLTLGLQGDQIQHHDGVEGPLILLEFVTELSADGLTTSVEQRALEEGGGYRRGF